MYTNTTVATSLDTLIKGYLRESNSGAGHLLVREQLIRKGYRPEKYGQNGSGTATRYVHRQSTHTDMLLEVEGREPVFLSYFNQLDETVQDLLKKREDAFGSIYQAITPLIGLVAGGIVGHTCSPETGAGGGALLGGTAGLIGGMLTTKYLVNAIVDRKRASIERELAHHSIVKTREDALYAALGQEPQD